METEFIRHVVEQQEVPGLHHHLPGSPLFSESTSHKATPLLESDWPVLCRRTPGLVATERPDRLSDAAGDQRCRPATQRST